MEKKKGNSASWILAKINLGIFILFILPSIWYSIYIARSSQIWSSKFPAFFLEVFALPLTVLPAVGCLVSFIQIFYGREKAVMSFMINLSLSIFYILLAFGKVLYFLRNTP
ncbi:MAG: hypothetical protein V1883_03620 [Candidatus Omnitrophota bacterium]